MTEEFTVASGTWIAGLALVAVMGAGGAFASEPGTAGSENGAGSAGSSAATPQPAQKGAARPGAAAGQPIDLPALEQRLRDTNAIGVMTKITLKNQVDELLERFKAHHEGRDATPLSQLRPPFDTLMLKVLALLQDKDPKLASSIAASREALWAMLTDRSQFSRM
jgi:hypothetical protein